MNILPKAEVEFAKADYWDKFFKERGSKKFEWYGEYNELCGELHKYIKSKDNILVVGCGNSRLSSDLYDVGCRNITNVDISSVVIKKMKEKEGKIRKDMVFMEMDALNMSFDNEIFTVVLDKGTLDALMPLDSEEDHNRAERLFSEVNRVLKIGGRYVVVSLLQHHILKRILSCFTENGWMVRIVRCVDVEKKNILENDKPGMPVFLVVCTKLKKIENIFSILETNIYINDNLQRIKSVDEVLKMVDGVQKAVMQLEIPDDEVTIEYCKNGEDKIKYLIHFIDASTDQKLLKKYGAFIVPQGRESEWMFSTKNGRKCLLKETGFDRLAIIARCKDQIYEDKKQIQEELARTILEFAPVFMENSGTSGIPYMTIGDDEVKETVFRTVSELSGEIVVDEVEVNSQRFRRLVFMDNQAVVQSEVRLIKDIKKNSYKIDTSYVLNSHATYMSVPAGLVKDLKSVLVIGVGGGSLCTLLNKVYPKVNILGVELDPVIVNLAKEYFGLKEGRTVNIMIKDGVEVIKEQNKHDIIMLDVDSKEQGSAMTSPPPQFLEDDVLMCVKNSIGDTGVFVINVVSRVEKVHKNLIKKLKKHFKLALWYNMKDSVNRIVFLSNSDVPATEWRNSMVKAAKNLKKNARQTLDTDSILDLDHFEAKLCA